MEFYKMNLNINRVVLILVFGLLLINTATAADDNKHTTAKSFLQQQVDSMDISYRPIAQMVADNIVAVFLFFGAIFLLYDGLMTSRKKKQGKTAEAAEHKNSLIETAKILGLTLILFAIFVAAAKSNIIGLT
jgi:hypothetical protein